MHSEGVNDDYFYDTAFVEGLGQTKGLLGAENGLLAQGGFYLIYYHLVSGEAWGSPYYFRQTDGISSVNTPIAASLTPNPVTDAFRVSLRDISTLPVSFTLRDATGRVMFRKTLSSPITDMSRDGLTAGLYIWTISAEAGAGISYGKMVVK